MSIKVTVSNAKEEVFRANEVEATLRGSFTEVMDAMDDLKLRRKNGGQQERRTAPRRRRV